MGADKIIIFLIYSNFVLVFVCALLVLIVFQGSKEIKDIFEFKRSGKTEEERQLKAAQYLKIQFPDWSAKRIAGALGISESTLRRTGFKMRSDRSLSDDDRSLSDDDRSLSER